MVLLLGAILLLLACSRPKPPTITPTRGVVTAMGPAGIELRVELAVDNPNRVAISVRSVDAQMVIDKHYNLGRVTVPHPVELPPGERSSLDVPLSVRWSDLPALVALSAAGRAVPYDVDGTVGLGGDLLHVEVPFHLTGEITQAQLVQAARNSLPMLQMP